MVPEEIMSAQIIFPDRMNADEVREEIWKKIKEFEKEIENLKTKVTEVT